MQTFTIKSFRTRYLLVAIITIASTFIFISFIENYISTSSKAGLKNIEQRLSVAQLNTRLHTHTQTSVRLLNLYLFSPTRNYRTEFFKQLEASQKIANLLQQNSWVHTQQLEPKIEQLKKLLDKLLDRSNKLMKIRLDGEKMYPAMRLANGSMRKNNTNIITLLNAALLELQTEHKSNNKTHTGIMDLRDKWRRTINAYRLYLINRLSSLSESRLPDQSSDVRLFQDAFIKKATTLKKIININHTGIETTHALTQIISYANSWLTGFNEVDKINMTNAWRGDIPIILNDIYPLFDQVYSMINTIGEKINIASILDVRKQHQASYDISFTLWGIEILLIALITIGYFILDHSLLKPLSKLSSTLRKNIDLDIDILLPDSQTKEIDDFVKAYQHMQSQIHLRQEKLEHIAMHDDLTNLPNRALLIDRMTLAISNSQRFKTNFGVIILDLDRFKEVNDTLGHLVGDNILQQVAERLSALLRDTDTVARLGGDEFSILLSNIDEKTISDIANKISNVIEEVYNVQEHNLYLGASLGISIYPQHGLTTEVLLKHADVAMYMAKRSDIDYVIYKPENDEHNIKQLSLLSDLRQAIDLNQLRLVYQPIYTTSTNIIIGYEALIRWQHPQYGLLMPDNFIQLAEQTGLIKKITLWVIGTALKNFSSWPVNHSDAYISINVTAWDLQDQLFFTHIKKSLKTFNVKPESLMLELSERSMMTDSTRIEISLNNLKTLGIRISIDDFGTGFSSLSILKQLPVSILKIDKSFVQKMSTIKNDTLIVHSIIDLAHNLELKVIAEGVEDTKSRNLLKDFNCDYCQGYLFSTPLDEEQLLSLIDVINSTGNTRTL
ncbi:diguanylate cyclase/phosphodiesterase (GGDEF & EAL domains) with PAS/PAC sensor(s) [hydrothermal vent metagenome]|uniref:Diguanylate cyclase/phosphodiesterase (GGDEF & EAL domains) with PAS/PAC sensor(S) n=1 Tax=hydrothermal vent metagenome TaxID=652676 RepID=A0A3B1AR14_9ZZZZ